MHRQLSTHPRDFGKVVSLGRLAGPSAAHFGKQSAIEVLTDFQDFSTVQDVPPRRHVRALALGFLFFLGCGPVAYLKEVTSRAAVALTQAKVDGAEQSAPYELTKAKLYYDKAREDGGHAYFQNAIDWGRRSQDCSRRASALAKAARGEHGGDSPRPNQVCGEL
jgi:hypothetical protein